MHKAVIDDFLDMLVAERGVRPLTIDAYKRDLYNFYHYITAHNITLSTMARGDIEHYLVYLKQQKLTASTIARKLSAIKQLCQFLVEEDYINDNVAHYIRTPKKARILPNTLSQDDINHLMAALETLPQYDKIRLKSMVEILYAAGLRVSELVTLPNNVIRHDQHYMIILGKGDKERMVPLHEQALQAIYDYMAIRQYFVPKGQKNNPYLFPSNGKTGHITRQRVGQLLKHIAVQAGLNPRDVSPHIIRHAFATHLLDNGANLRALQMLLGHEDISTTEIYTHVSNKRMKKMLEEKHPLHSKHRRDKQ